MSPEIPQLRKNCAVFSCTEEETAYWRGILKSARRGRVTSGPPEPEEMQVFLSR